MGILNNVAVQWLIRRVPEVAGIVSALIAFFAGMPPEVQAVVMAVLTGQGGGLTVMAYFGVASWLWAQWNSYRATVRPQTVVKTIEGTSVRVEPEKPVVYPSEVSTPRRTLWDVLTGK